MNVKIHTYFNQQTPLSEASNDDELAQIFALRYPHSRGNLKISATAFKRMIDEARQYEAWRVIGYKSFAAFCEGELNTSIEVVEDVLAGFRQLQENGQSVEVTAADAAKVGKQQRYERNLQIHADREAGMTQQAIAEKYDISRGRVAQVLLENPVMTEKTNKPRTRKKVYQLNESTDPQAAAEKLREKFGAEYCRNLARELTIITEPPKVPDRNYDIREQPELF